MREAKVTGLATSHRAWNAQRIGPSRFCFGEEPAERFRTLGLRIAQNLVAPPLPSSGVRHKPTSFWASLNPKP